MNRLIAVVGLGLIVFVCVAASPNLNNLDGFDRLSASQKQLLERVLKTTNCYYGCDDTVWECLKQNSRAAYRIANFMVRRLLEGADEQRLREAIKKRESSAFPAKKFNIPVDGLTPSGDPKAPVKVVIFADFKCPYCKIASPALRRLSQEMKGKIVVYFKQFPVKSHGRLAIDGALAAVAADKQGKFWCMHDELFKLANAGKLESKEDIFKAARACALDLERLKRDMSDKSTIDRVRAEKKEGIGYGVIGTPGIFINGKYYSGIKTYVELKDRIEEELEILAGAE